LRFNPEAEEVGEGEHHPVGWNVVRAGHLPESIQYPLEVGKGRPEIRTVLPHLAMHVIAQIAY
jgi:hypothetical protein